MQHFPKFAFTIYSIVHSFILGLVLSEEIDADGEEDIWSHRMYWDDDVYTGRHFDELTSYFNDAIGEKVVDRHTVLVLYNDKIFTDIDTYNINRNDLPGYHFLNFFKFNLRTTERHIWYDLRDVDNLVKRYLNGKYHLSIPHILFFKAGNRLTQYVEFPHEVFDLKEDSNYFKTWVWHQLRMNSIVENKLDESVYVKLYDGPPIADRILAPGEKLVVETHVSSKVVIVTVDHNKFVYGFLVEQLNDDEVHVIDREQQLDFMILKEQQFLQDFNEQISEYNAIRRERYYSIAQEYLRLFKQPLLIEQYTEVGYQVHHIPKVLLRNLTDFYNRNMNRRQRGCILADGNKNGGDVDCSTIPMDLSMKEYLVSHVKRQVEKWCGKALEMTFVYGITEYYETSVIIQNLGQVSSHVISIEFILAKDLQGKPDWELEILDNKGDYSYTYVDVGMMIFYEGSSVTIKRPKELKGRSYVTVVAHFRPLLGWPWRLAVDNSVMSNGHEFENLRVLNTPATLRSELRKVPTKPPPVPHSHSGEL